MSSPCVCKKETERRGESSEMTKAEIRSDRHPGIYKMHEVNCFLGSPQKQPSDTSVAVS